MNAEKKVAVAQAVTNWIVWSGKSREQIATAMGYDSTAVLDRWERGSIKLPINMVKPFAEASAGDSVGLFEIVLAEYVPETWAAFQDILGAWTLSDYEKEVISGYRSLARDAGKDIGVVIVPTEHGYVQVTVPKLA
jgi:hypothetical protein